MYSKTIKSRILPSLGLLILLLAACAPAAVAPEAPEGQPAAPVAVEASVTPIPPVDSAPDAQPADEATAPTEAVVPQPVATSRGDDLHATNPSTVNLASGGLQLVEFFRFT